MASFHCPTNFPINLIFDFAEWRKEENFKSILKPEEDIDMYGNKKCFFMNVKFTIIILQDIVDAVDDTRSDFKAKIPNFTENFDTLFVSKEVPKPTTDANVRVNPFAAFD